MSRRTPFLLLALSVLAAPAILFAPLLSGVPKANDFPDHLGMAAQVSDQLDAGVFRPRWMPDFNGGWGEPTLVYYPPGLALAVAIAGKLLGGRLAVGFFLVLALATAVGGAGMFALGRALAGNATAGLLAAVAFALAPYRFFSLWEAGLSSAFVAGALLPWLLLATARVLEPAASPGRRRWLLAYPLLYAAICWMNLPMAVISAHLVAAIVVVETAISRRLRPLLELALAGGLGALLAAEHVLPALVELGDSYMPVTRGGRRWETEFVFQSEGSTMSPGLAATFARLALFPALALALSLLLVARDGRGADRAEGSPPLRRQLAVAGFYALLLVTPLSAPLWRILPALRSINFPWRILDALSLAAAALCGAAIARMLRRGEGLPLRAIALLLFALLGLAAADLDRSIASANGRLPMATMQSMIPVFRARPMFFIPIAAKPAAEMPNAPLFDADRPTAAGEVHWGPVRRTMRIVAEEPTTLRLRTYFFPGWRARTEGKNPQELPVRADPRDGALLVKVPKGDHRIVVEFGSRPIRRAGALVSLVAVVAWIAAALLARWSSATTNPASGLDDR